VSRLAPLALTLGDPAGIGPEIVLKAWQALRDSGPEFVVVGDVDAFGASPLVTTVPTTDRVDHPLFRQAMPVLSSEGPSGETIPQAVIRWIETATALALAGDVCGLVTAPIAKSRLYDAGFAFPGHTEFLAELTASAPHPGPRGPVMMLTARDLRVVLVTIHTPLSRVAAEITTDKVVHTARVTAQALRGDFGIASPRLALAGLNPHAGEHGSIGREEIEVLTPAVAALRSEGIDITGPRPADTLFHEEARRAYDAVVCLYHDQALIPVKTLDFWGGVNVTLGLPIVRTSPDHGTGFDIAGRGIARPDSLIQAIRLAAGIAERRTVGA
jgi:4-hydroxythreonine-4-phosphate dehydrogenase